MICVIYAYLRETTMPHLKRGTQLWFRKARRDERGNSITRGVWIIIEGGRHFPTGCFKARRKILSESAYLPASA
jgi:hypothetical protein